MTPEEFEVFAKYNEVLLSAEELAKCFAKLSRSCDWACDKLEKLAALIESDSPNPRYDAASVRAIMHALKRGNEDSEAHEFLKRRLNEETNR